MIEYLQLALSSFYETLKTVIWFVMPVFFISIWWQFRLYTKRIQFIGKIKWDMLEIRIPRDNIKTPKSMEQVFAGMLGIYTFGIKPTPKYLDGMVDRWASFEMVGYKGGVRFFVRISSADRHLLESLIYGQYPGAEVIPAVDYTTLLPSVLPNENYDLWGTGFTLAKDSAYPIRTYPFFDDPREIKDEKRVDPISSIFEAMSRLKDEEMIWLQLMISPTGAATGNDMKKKGEEVIKKIIEEKGPKKSDKDGAAIPANMSSLSPMYQEAIKGIENKTNKHCFEVVYRFIYIDKKDTFSALNVSAIMGSFQQLNTSHMNSMRPDGTITLMGNWRSRFIPWYKKSKVLTKKRMLYDSYINRRFGYSNHASDEKFPIMCTEELATLYHFPSVASKAPRLQKIDSRRGEPPVNLPIE